MATSTRRLSFGLLAAVLFLACFALALVLSRRDGQADDLPGTVLQAGTAESNGVTLRAENAVFSGTATDVWVKASVDDPSIRLAGIEPRSAHIDSQTATSAVVSSDGRVSLRFARLDGAQNIKLNVESVLVMGANGSIAALPGHWQIELVRPDGKDADAISELTALQPGVVEAAGERIIVEAFRTSAATIVRYSVPVTIVEGSQPPNVSADGRRLEPKRSIQREAEREFWFDASPGGASISVAFPSLLVSDAAGSDAILSLELGQPGAENSDAEATTLAWSRSDSSNVGIVSVVRHRDPEKVTIRVLVEGLWSPALGTRPEVIADGKLLFVNGVGNYPAMAGGAQTSIEAVLPDGSTPRSLVVKLLGGNSKEVSAEVSLHP